MNSVAAVKSATRVLDLLELLAADEMPMGVSEAARRLGIPKSSTSMLLATLEARGYVVGGEARRFQLNPLFSQSGRSWVGGSSFVLLRHAKGPMEELAAASRESSFLGVPRDEQSCEYIAKVVTPNEVRCDSDLHRPRELHSTSVGLVLLAFQDVDRTERFLQRGRFEKVTPRTLTDPRHIRAELEATRRRGYALVADTNSPDASGFAAPIFDATGAVVAAINLSAPSSRFEGMPRRFAADLLRAAAAITRQLGGKPPKASRKSP